MIAWIQLGKLQPPQLGSLSLQSYQNKPVHLYDMLWVIKCLGPTSFSNPMSPRYPSLLDHLIAASTTLHQPFLRAFAKLSDLGVLPLHNTWYSAQRMYNKKRFVRENNPSFCHAIAVAIIRDSFSYANLLLSGDLPSHHPGRRP